MRRDPAGTRELSAFMFVLVLVLMLVLGDRGEIHFR
jgi:hypothetical protein